MTMRRTAVRPSILAGLAAFLTAARGLTLDSQTQTLSLPPDSPRWELEGNAKATEYLGRKCLLLDGGAATVKDFDMRDGVVDVDVAASSARGFAGFQFRIAADGQNAEEIYLRPHESGYPDAIQYTPILSTGRNWQIYNGPGFTAAVDIPRDSWFHVRLAVTGAQAKLFVNDLESSVERIQALKRQQIARQTAGRQATRQLAKAVADSRYTAGCLRSYLKACADFPNEERFGITLARKRSSRRKACSASPKTQAN